MLHAGNLFRKEPERFLPEKGVRNEEKHVRATGNPVKAGYIIMICPGFCPRKHAVPPVLTRIPLQKM
jgi:hypothetical protein